MQFAKAKTDFLEYLEIEQNRSQKTIQNYDHYLTRLEDFGGDIKLSDITPEFVQKWRLWLNRLGTNTSDELAIRGVSLTPFAGCHPTHVIHACKHPRWQ